MLILPPLLPPFKRRLIAMIRKANMRQLGGWECTSPASWTMCLLLMVVSYMIARTSKPGGRNILPHYSGGRCKKGSRLLVLRDGEVRTQDILDALFNKKPPAPNQSTQNKPLSSTNFLYELDQQTQAQGDI